MCKREATYRESVAYVYIDAMFVTRFREVGWGIHVF